MPHRKHLTTVRVASALRDTLAASPYTRQTLSRDVVAGVTVGVIAVPLAMALAIAIGVPPQYGLYSAVIAGAVAALTGGSRFSVTGPTAAFVVVLAPVVSAYGLAGLTIATIIAGLLLVGLGVARMGRLIEYVPEPVTVGFTAGIAIVLAVLQLNDLLGLGITEMPEHFVAKVATIVTALPAIDWPTAFVGVLTLVIVLAWPRDRFVVPGHVPALIVGALCALALAQAGHPIDTIGSRFTYLMADGTLAHGIPTSLPTFSLPWDLPGPGGARFEWSYGTLRGLLPSALTIAMLGAIESLLCAVVLDRSTGTRHHANGELVGQGLANVVAPFFGGITSTAAIARSAASVRAGARTPVAAVVHSGVVLLSIVVLGPLLSFLPMSSMAALLVSVAWHMSEAPHAVRLVRTAPAADVLVFSTCLVLTVFTDMVVAIAVGIVLAALLFMRDSSRFTQVRDVTDSERYVRQPLPEGWRVYKIVGALFFAAAERVFSEILWLSADGDTLVLYADGVTVLDAGGTGALERFLDECEERGITVIIADLQEQPLRALTTSSAQGALSRLTVAATLDDALAQAAAGR